jgi:hypothetical protein
MGLNRKILDKLKQYMPPFNWVNNDDLVEKDTFTFVQDGNFADGIFAIVAPTRRCKLVGGRAGSITAFTGTTSAGTLTINKSAASPVPLTAELALAPATASPGDHASAAFVLVSSDDTRTIAAGELIMVEFDDAAAGDGALGIDTVVQIEVEYLE